MQKNEGAAKNCKWKALEDKDVARQVSKDTFVLYLASSQIVRLRCTKSPMNPLDGDTSVYARGLFQVQIPAHCDLICQSYILTPVWEETITLTSIKLVSTRLENIVAHLGIRTPDDMLKMNSALMHMGNLDLAGGFELSDALTAYENVKEEDFSSDSYSTIVIITVCLTILILSIWSWKTISRRWTRRRNERLELQRARIEARPGYHRAPQENIDLDLLARRQELPRRPQVHLNPGGNVDNVGGALDRGAILDNYINMRGGQRRGVRLDNDDDDIYAPMPIDV
jgi:hypothetical protein